MAALNWSLICSSAYDLTQIPILDAYTSRRGIQAPSHTWISIDKPYIGRCFEPAEAAFSQTLEQGPSTGVSYEEVRWRSVAIRNGARRSTSVQPSLGCRPTPGIDGRPRAEPREGKVIQERRSCNLAYLGGQQRAPAHQACAAVGG